MSLSAFSLDNGLQVAVVENDKAPVILQQVLYKTGSLYDPKGKGGIAHLLEHMMFRGTDKLPGKMFDNLTQKYGADANAYTTYDETGYYEFSDISKLELMMAMEAERMARLKMGETDFVTERGVVLQERKQRFESNPVPLFYETLNRVLWQDHPFYLCREDGGLRAQLYLPSDLDADAAADRLAVFLDDVDYMSAQLQARQEPQRPAMFWGGF